MALIINGIELEIDDASAKIVSDEVKRLSVRADAAEAKVVTAEAKVTELQTEAGKQAVELHSVKSRVDAAEQRVAKIDRAELEQAAKIALGAEFKFDGQTDGAIKAAVVAKMLPSVRMDGVDAAFVQGAYSAALALATDAAAKREQAARESGTRADSNAADPSKAREEMIAARRNLAASKS